jgi:LAGLIDADG DNA endonuclease family protein
MKHVQHVGSRLQNTMSTELAWYITGFVDGEGCFSISFNKREKLTTGVEVRPSFAVGQNKKSLSVLQLMHTYFGCGAIRFSKSDQMYKYEVRSVSDLRKHIIPHFEKYPLKTVKSTDFETFKYICTSITSSKHLNKVFLAELLTRAYTMNLSGKRKYQLQELLKIIEAR